MPRHLKPPPEPDFRNDYVEVKLVFCHRCGCTYTNWCPTHHESKPVIFKPGRAGFVIAALALTGCAHYGQVYTVYVSPAFAPDVQETAGRATADWSSQVPVTLIETVAPCPGLGNQVICVAPGSLPQNPGVGQYIGWTHNQGDGGQVTIDVIAAGGDLFWIFVHELGHAMGLKHVATKAAVMYPTTQGAKDLTCNDVNQWRTLRSLPSIPCP